MNNIDGIRNGAEVDSVDRMCLSPPSQIVSSRLNGTHLLVGGVGQETSEASATSDDSLANDDDLEQTEPATSEVSAARKRSENSLSNRCFATHLPLSDVADVHGDALLPLVERVEHPKFC